MWNKIHPHETAAGSSLNGPSSKRLRPWVIFVGSILFLAFLILLDQKIEIPNPFYILPFVIGAWSAIAAAETDADSPVNQTLMDKIRGNLDWLYARIRDIPTDANWVNRSHLKMSVVEVSIAAAAGNTVNDNKDISVGGEYVHFPKLKRITVAPAILDDAIVYIHVSDYGGAVVPEDPSYATLIALRLVVAGAGGSIALYANLAYHAASRDAPCLFLKRNKNDGRVIGSTYLPEPKQARPPEMADSNNEEVLCLELNHPELLRHLRKNKNGGFLDQLHLALLWGILRIENETTPKHSTKDQAPCLYHSAIKVVNFSFDKDAANRSLDEWKKIPGYNDWVKEANR